MNPSKTPANTRRLRKAHGFLLASAGVLVAVILGQSLWTVHQRNELIAAIQKYRAEGEPVLPQDFAPPVVEDPDNPVPEWRAAMAALKPLDPQLQDHADTKEFSVPLTQAEDDFLRQLLDRQGDALAHADAASRMQGKPEWGIHFVSPTLMTMLPDLRDQRQLATLLKRAALDAHFRGDDGQAVERLLQMVAEARSLHHHPTLVAHLVALGIESMACDTARTIGPELRIGSSSDTSVRPAPPEKVRQLIAQLLDDRPLREGQILAFRTERMMEVDMGIQLATGNASMPNTNVGGRGRRMLESVLSSQFYGDARFLLEYTSGVLRAAQAPDWPMVRARMNTLPDVGRKRGVWHLLISLLLPAFDRAIQTDFQVLTDDRLTAVLFASRLYGRDHDGAFPGSLNDLTPYYLPSLPLDPFATGMALRYRAGSDPVVYSVGENGTDEGGSEQRTGPRGADDRWHELDVVTHLRLQPYQAPPEDSTDTTEGSPVATNPATQP